MSPTLQRPQPGSSRGALRLRCTWHELGWPSPRASACTQPAYARSRFGQAVFLCRDHYAALRRSDARVLFALALVVPLLPLGLLAWQVGSGAEVHPLALALEFFSLAPAAVLAALAVSAAQEGQTRRPQGTRGTQVTRGDQAPPANEP